MDYMDNDYDIEMPELYECVDETPEEDDMKGVADYIAKKSDTYYDKNVSGFFAKYPYVSNFANEHGGRILDAGCGSGNYARELIKEGYDVFAIDHSKTCCEKYLKDVPHENKSLIELYDSNTDKFSCVICTDVLEHILPEEIDENLEAISNLSDNFMFGIANHPDVQFGYHVHRITEDKFWWIDKLSEYFDNVEHIADLFLGQFFFIKCSN